MTGRGIVLFLALVLILTTPLAAEAQQAERVYKVGILVRGQPLTPEELARTPFRTALQELGWVEGRNIAFERRPSMTVEALDGLAAELVQLKVDVIFSEGTPATFAARRATKTIPIVMLVGFDPVAGGLVTSLPRPGGNITGLTAIHPELFGKRLQSIKEVVPGAVRVAALYNPSNPAEVLFQREQATFAETVGVKLLLLPVRGADEFDNAFAAMKTQRAEALMVTPDSMMFTHRTRLAELAAQYRIPAIYGYRQNAEAGGLMVYSADWTALYRRAAVFVDKVLKGAKPADLPVEQPTKFELVINMKTAKALGLTIPPSLLLRADQVIE